MRRGFFGQGFLSTHMNNAFEKVAIAAHLLCSILSVGYTLGAGEPRGVSGNALPLLSPEIHHTNKARVRLEIHEFVSLPGGQGRSIIKVIV